MTGQEKISYDLQSLEAFCRSEGLAFERTSSEELLVRIDREIGLRIANSKAGDDPYLGLSDGTWHTHGKAIFMTGADTYVEFEPQDVLAALRSGVLLIGSRYLRGELKDRWLFHRLQKQDFKHLEADEQINVRRADPAVESNTAKAANRT